MSSSTHKAEVFQVDKIETHPNADKMELLKVWGFTCCSRIGQFKVGDLAVYIQPDSIVPPSEKYAFLNKGEPLSDFPERRRRITAKRLRGVISQGLIVAAPEGAKVGDDVAEAFGITHYEPKPNCNAPMQGGNSAIEKKPSSGYFPHYDVEQFNRFLGEFSVGETVVATEKVHGANACFCFRDDQFFIRSRKSWKAPTRETFLKDARGFWQKLWAWLGFGNFAKKENDWWIALNKHPEVKNFLRARPEIVLYGEIYGKVQSLRYGKAGEVDLVLFDMLLDNEWVDFNAVRLLVHRYQLPWVPIVYEGRFNEEALRKFAESDSHLARQNKAYGQTMEGIVIKPTVERTSLRIGRVQAKLVSNRYYLGR